MFPSSLIVEAPVADLAAWLEGAMRDVVTLAAEPYPLVLQPLHARESERPGVLLVSEGFSWIPGLGEWRAKEQRDQDAARMAELLQRAGVEPDVDDDASDGEHLEDAGVVLALELQALTHARTELVAQCYRPEALAYLQGVLDALRRRYEARPLDETRSSETVSEGLPEWLKGWQREAVGMWPEADKGEIARRLGKREKTVENLFSRLRNELGEELVPYSPRARRKGV